MNVQTPGQETVVSLDDSRSTRTALSWAADYARAVGLRLRAVHVFSEPRAAMGWAPDVPGLAPLGGWPSAAEMHGAFGEVQVQVL